MTAADDLERDRAALTVIHGEPFNAEAPPAALEGDKLWEDPQNTTADGDCDPHVTE